MTLEFVEVICIHVIELVIFKFDIVDIEDALVLDPVSVLICEIKLNFIGGEEEVTWEQRIEAENTICVRFLDPVEEVSSLHLLLDDSDVETLAFEVEIDEGFNIFLIGVGAL